MIDGFTVGKRYRVDASIGAIDTAMWNENMKLLLDGQPRLCIKADWDGLYPNSGKDARMCAAFEGIPMKQGKFCWDYSGDQEIFEEVRTVGKSEQEEFALSCDNPRESFQSLLSLFEATGVGSGGIYEYWDRGEHCMELRLHTGGWSECEEILDTIARDNPLFWTLFWYQSTRGGHHTFRYKIK